MFGILEYRGDGFSGQNTGGSPLRDDAAMHSGQPVADAADPEIACVIAITGWPHRSGSSRAVWQRRGFRAAGFAARAGEFRDWRPGEFISFDAIPAERRLRP